MRIPVLKRPDTDVVQRTCDTYEKMRSYVAAIVQSAGQGDRSICWRILASSLTFRFEEIERYLHYVPIILNIIGRKKA